MQITSFNVHGITEVRIERDQSGSALWTNLHIIGPEGTVTVTVFADEGYAEVIDETSDVEPEIEPRGAYEPASYREDMIAAGRGHLLGE